MKSYIKSFERIVLIINITILSLNICAGRSLSKMDVHHLDNDLQQHSLQNLHEKWHLLNALRRFHGILESDDSGIAAANQVVDMDHLAERRNGQILVKRQENNHFPRIGKRSVSFRDDSGDGLGTGSDHMAYDRDAYDLAQLLALSDLNSG